MEKKLRFGDLVRNSGRLQTLTLWTKPEKNPRLKRAINENRVLTVIQEPGKPDYGAIGFQLHPGASYFIFPRPLPRPPEARVIGIKYQLLDEPLVDGALAPTDAKPTTTRANPKLATLKPRA